MKSVHIEGQEIPVDDHIKVVEMPSYRVPVSESQLYRINDLYPSIQGEGMLTGIPMWIVRLHGCGVGCSFCDTKETWSPKLELKEQDPNNAYGANPRWWEMSAFDLFDLIQDRQVGKKPHSIGHKAMRYEPHGEGIKWLMLTGGEPAEQNLQQLLSHAKARDFKVQIETSGTARGHLDDYGRRYSGLTHVCCSPKINMPGGLAIIADVLRDADELKFVVGRHEDLDKIDQVVDQYSLNTSRISLQPMSCSRKATDLVTERAMKNGWRVSIQTHKQIGVP